MAWGWGERQVVGKDLWGWLSTWTLEVYTQGHKGCVSSRRLPLLRKHSPEQNPRAVLEECWGRGSPTSLCGVSEGGAGCGALTHSRPRVLAASLEDGSGTHCLPRRLLQARPSLFLLPGTQAEAVLRQLSRGGPEVQQGLDGEDFLLSPPGRSPSPSLEPCGPGRPCRSQPGILPGEALETSTGHAGAHPPVR